MRYRRLPDRPVEAMHAHFERHAYHPHSHDTYSFGLTEFGAQEFGCRGEHRTSAAGMVMAFNPEDPHDGWAAGALGFTYRMVHIGPELLADVLTDGLARPGRRPLFAAPVLHDALAAAALRRLHAAVMGGAPALRRDELLAAAVAALSRQATQRMPEAAGRPRRSPSLASRVREHLHAAYLDNVRAEELARAAGHSRFAVYREFRAAYGMSPSEYQRQLRLRAARGMLAAGCTPARAAADAGFADQAHLTRWFVRCFGVTPGASRRGDSER